jgi:hypothetical protein
VAKTSGGVTTRNGSGVMSMDVHEREVRAILKRVKAKLKRISNSSHELWELPDGSVFVCPRAGRSGEWRSWRNNMRDLRKKLGSLQEAK